MVIISHSKVNNAIPDRFQVFLNYQNHFWMLQARLNGKKLPQNDLNWPYFGLSRPILVTFTLYFLLNQLLEMISFPQCALRFFIAPLDFDVDALENFEIFKRVYVKI